MIETTEAQGNKYAVSALKLKNKTSLTFFSRDFTRKTAPSPPPPPPWRSYINKTNVFIKFQDGWAKSKLPRPPGSHVFKRTGTIFELNSLFTCFHYIHLEKTAPPTDCHVFSPI
ncbi:hypothetical protein DPMN_156589 [Dreissena polymorpha]|uniref:Uncharacterized protein n=1 Tax=Dreissena polymorpha TaxID=45954 RepID=A0A9D4FVX5_DREPO|nr:hypothetical protein DPMN_156589 [Dreissena polymorpha]